MIQLENKNVSEELTNALKNGNETEIKNAWENYKNSIIDQIKKDMETYKDEKDEEILLNRGYRRLTSKEKNWYGKVIDAMKSSNPKNAFASIIGSSDEEDIMPSTILEDVFKNLQEVHPLLSRVNFVNVKYLTKWIRNTQNSNSAVWGAINSQITQAIADEFEVVDIKQNKLSCYAVIEKDMLDLGPTFLDAYIRASLFEAMANGLENGIINGRGSAKNEPIGLIRDIHRGVTIDSTNGYPSKTAVEVADFTPLSYGALLGTLAKTEAWTDSDSNPHGGKDRNFKAVDLIVNQKEYLTKIMPATTMLANNGAYAKDLFPFPTNVIISNKVADDTAIICLLDEYFCGVGASKDGVIEYSDDVNFLEDQRVFKIKTYADGMASDNTCAILLDISDVEPAYLNVVAKVDTI